MMHFTLLLQPVHVATQEATLVSLPDIHDAVATKADIFSGTVHNQTCYQNQLSANKNWHPHASSAKATKARHGNLQY